MKMNKQELKKFSQEYAESKGFVLQPDERMLDGILSGLLRNEEKHGFRVCPCRRVTDDEEENKRITCPCAYHEAEIKRDGHCKCFLFLKK